MAEQHLWIFDKDTQERVRVSYGDLDNPKMPQIMRPIGGFCYSAGAFLQIDLPKAPYYIQGWLPKQGKAMLYAPAKSGKSFLSQQLARCIGCGDDFLGIPTTLGVVLYLQFELGEEVLQRRMRLTSKPYDNVYVGTSFSLKLDTNAGQSQLEAAISAVKPNVVILDPLYKLLRGDENVAQDVLTVLDVLDAYIEQYKCSFFLVHHTGYDTTHARGSSVFEGWVDAAIELKRISQKGEPLAVRLTPKLLRHAELPPEPIEACMTNFEFEAAGERLQRETCKSKVEAYIKKSGVAKITDMVKEGVAKRKTIYNALDTLTAEGKVEQVGRGEYRWAASQDTAQSISEIMSF